MKMIAGLLMVAFIAAGIYADNQVVAQKYRHEQIGNDRLGIVLLSVKAKIVLKFLGDLDIDKQQTMVYEKLFQGLPQAFEGASSCTRTEMCTTAVRDSILPRRFLLDHNDTMVLNVPLHMHFAGDKATWPRHCLIIEITDAYDDSSTKEVQVAMVPGYRPMMGATSRSGVRPSGGNLGLVDLTVKDKEKPEECLHYECKYAFVDCSNNAFVCWGTVSAEGCSASVSRDGPNGVWNISIKELVKQIVENTPFELK